MRRGPIANRVDPEKNGRYSAGSGPKGCLRLLGVAVGRRVWSVCRATGRRYATGLLCREWAALVALNSLPLLRVCSEADGGPEARVHWRDGAAAGGRGTRNGLYRFCVDERFVTGVATPRVRPL